MRTKLGPGWLCHPNDPPGAILFERTWRSEAPVMLIFEAQAPTLPLVLKGLSFPTPNVVGVTPDGGVAMTVPA